MIAATSKSGNLKLTAVYQISPKLAKRKLHIGEWVQDGALQIDNRSWKERRGDLSGLQLMAAANERWHESTANIWQDLSEVMHFNKSTISTENETMGVESTNGVWNGLIGKLTRREIDAIVTDVDLTVKRLEVIDFLHPLHSHKFQIILRSDGYIFDWLTVFKPFDRYVWALLILWIFLGAFSYKLVTALSTKYDLEGTKELSYVNCIFFVLQTLCIQGYNRVPKMLASRLIFLVCYLVAAVIIPSYSAALISALTQKIPFRPFDDLKGLLKANYHLIVIAQSGAYEYFEGYGHGTVQKTIFENNLIQVGSNMTKSEANDYLVNLLCHQQGYALFTNSAPYITYKLKDCEFVKIADAFGRGQQSIAFHKNSPFTELANYYILKFTEFGMINKHNSFHSFKKSSKLDTPSSLLPVLWLDVAEIFLFLALAIVVSTFILFGELYLHKGNRK